MSRLAGQLPALGAGRFQVRQKLGAGLTGVVYEAQDLARNSRVALKVLSQPSRELVTRLRRTFDELLELSHPNLVVLDEFFEEDDTCFFSMELVGGSDFLTFL